MRKIIFIGSAPVSGRSLLQWSKTKSCLSKMLLERIKMNQEMQGLVHIQCDQIGWFNGLLASFQSLCQQLICPNLPHSKAILVKVSKSIILLVKSFQGNFYRHLSIFFWSHCPYFKAFFLSLCLPMLKWWSISKILKEFFLNRWRSRSIFSKRFCSFLSKRYP